MDPSTYILYMVLSLGLRFYTNNKNIQSNNKAAELNRQKQEERLKCSQEQSLKDYESMRNRTAEEVAQRHVDRMTEIEELYDKCISDIAKGKTIKKWPLTVLPFVMKGESFGTYIGSGVHTIKIHCVLTPSNYKEFNTYLLEDIDFGLESIMNSSWNSISTHPVVYYGRCWKRDIATGRKVLGFIDLLYSELKTVPTIVITPYYDNDDSNLYIRVAIWGMGNGEDKFEMNIPTIQLPTKPFLSKETYPIERNQDFTNTVNELVSMIGTIIGWIADHYYGSLFGIEPYLPKALSERVFPYNGFSNISEGEEYEKLTLQIGKAKEVILFLRDKNDEFEKKKGLGIADDFLSEMQNQYKNKNNRI